MNDMLIEDNRAGRGEALKKPLVSIVIPIYNAIKHLNETLSCLASQTYRNIEIIMVDDGSEDGSADIARQYSINDNRFIYIWQENAGAGSARNHGIDSASGKYIMFLDSDDLFSSHMIECMVSNLEITSSDVCICRADMFSDRYEPSDAQPINYDKHLPSGSYKPEDFADMFFQKISTCPWDKMFRMEPILRNGLRFQHLRYSNDGFFVFTACLSSNYISFIDDVLVHYRVGQGGSLRDKMYLDPLCDLQMLDTLRKAFSNYCLADRYDARLSLDSFTLNLLFNSYITLASQSFEACQVFERQLNTVYLPCWNADSYKPLLTCTMKYRFKKLVITRATPDGVCWAVRDVSSRKIREGERKVWLRIYLRLVAALSMKRKRLATTS